MNRASFYAALRKRESGVFGTSLSQKQVDGCEAKLDALRGFSLPHAAHVLAECYHETGGKMWPVEENLNYSAKRIGQVFGAHRLQGIPARHLARNPERLANTVYGGDWGRKNLGNTQPGDGWKFRGMGDIQSTGRANAKKAAALTGYDLESHPEKMLDPRVSAEIAAEGCRSGMFRRYKLSDFDRPGGYDHAAARAIVNADVSVNGPKVARYALAFEKALAASGWGEQPPVRPDVEPPEPGKPSGGVGALIRALLGLFWK